MTTTPEVDELRAAYLLPYAGTTLSLYTYQLDRWLEWCAVNSIKPLLARRPDVEAYIHHLHQGLNQKPSSVHTALTPVRGFYRYIYNEEHISRDPAALARRPRVVRGVGGAVGLDRDQMRAFLATGERTSGRHHAIAYLLGCMALRASEACSIRIEDYQRTVKGHRVLEFTGKGSVPARMPIPVPVLRALDAAAAGRTSGPVIPSLTGRPLDRRGLYRLVSTLARRAGIQMHVNPHLLRHSCITNALEAGASLRKVQDLARHSDPRTTMGYDRNRTHLDDHAVHILVAFLSAEPPGNDEVSA
ncbi:MAG: tyrosine-type recombinase/integrase [Nocardioides sp.]